MEQTEAPESNEKSEEQKKMELIQNCTNEFLKMSHDVQNSIFRAILEVVPNERKSELKEIVDNSLKIDIVGEVPPEISLKILSYLDSYDLVGTSKVNRKWHVLSEDKSLWKSPIYDPLLKRDKQLSGEFPIFNSGRNFPSLIYESGEAHPLPMVPRTGRLFQRNRFKSNYLRYKRTLMNWGLKPIRRSAVKEIHNGTEIICMKLAVEYVVSSGEDLSLILSKLNHEFTIIPLIGHTDKVTIIELSECEKFIISGSMDHTIKVWSAENGECIATFNGHTMPILAISVNFCDLIVSSDGAQVIAWDMKTTHIFYNLGNANVTKILYYGLDLLTCSSRTVEIWDTTMPLYPIYKTTIPLWTNICDIKMERGLLNIIVVGCEGGDVSVWDLSTGAFITQLHGHVGPILKVEIVHYTSESYIMSMSEDSIRIWKYKQQDNWISCFSYAGFCRFVDFQTAGYLFVTNSIDGTLRLWHLEKGFIRNLFSLATVPQGSRIFSIKCNETTLAIACGSASQIEPSKLVVFNFDSNFP